jgi:cytoskeletal protein RodZ
MLSTYHPPEKSLGVFLKEHRQQRAITQEQICSATKIGLKIIQAIESDNYANLPAKPFVRGFIFAIARFIGLNANEVMQEYTSFLDYQIAQNPTKQRPLTGYAFDKKSSETQQKTYLAIAMGVTIAVAGTGILIFRPNLLRHKNTTVEALVTPLQPSAPMSSQSFQEKTLKNPLTTQSSSLALPTPPGPDKPIAPPPQPTPLIPKLAAVEPAPVLTENAVATKEVSAPITKDIRDPLDSGVGLPASQVNFKIVLSIEEDIWVRYQVDARPIRKFIVRRGNKLVLRAQDKLQLEVSKASAIKIHSTTPFQFPEKAPFLIALPKDQKAVLLGEVPLRHVIPAPTNN